MKTSLAGKVALAAGATSGGLVVEVTDGTAAIADAFAT
jgi:hypothetical protein